MNTENQIQEIYVKRNSLYGIINSICCALPLAKHEEVSNKLIVLLEQGYLGGRRSEGFTLDIDVNTLKEIIGRN
jgi:hypothetical protein